MSGFNPLLDQQAFFGMIHDKKLLGLRYVRRDGVTTPSHLTSVALDLDAHLMLYVAYMIPYG